MASQNQDFKDDQNFIVVTDFDGTITQQDIGNELCKEVIPELFQKTHTEYRAGRINLKDMQKLFWERFPLPEQKFIASSMTYGKLRPGAQEFLEVCQERGIPVYVASCGLRPYIEAVLAAHLSPKALKAVHGIRCNEVKFGPNGVVEFTAPDNEIDSPYPLHKGQWSQDLQKKHAGKKVLAIGNGSSDKSFVGFVDSVAATESFAEYCKSKNQPYLYFESFTEIIEKHPWFLV